MDKKMMPKQITYGGMVAEKPGVPQVRMTSKEIMVTELLGSVVAMLKHNERYVEDRLKTIENGAEMWETVLKTADRLERELEYTGTDGNRKQIAGILTHGRFKVELMPVASQDNMLCVRESAMMELLRCSLKEKCSMCLNDCREAEKCRLYRAVVDVMPPPSFDVIGCPYRYIDWDDEDGDDRDDR